MTDQAALMDTTVLKKQTLRLRPHCDIQLFHLLNDSGDSENDSDSATNGSGMGGIISPERFDDILSASISSLLDALSTKLKSHDTHDDDDDVSQRILQPSDSPVYAALVYLFVESARVGATALVVSTYLEECHMVHGSSVVGGGSLSTEQERRVEAIANQYDTHRRRLLRTLLHYYNRGFQFVPQLIDLDYRLDYVVKTSDLQRTNEVLYTLRFICSNDITADREEDVITMTCTVEQLQDLYTKLKDATHQVQRTLAQE